MSEIKKLTQDELNCLEEITFFKRKKIVTDHISQLFSALNTSVIAVNQDFKGILPEEVIQSAGKISKGENYLGFPWLVLDMPRVFQKNDVFAFRSMLWWGHEISFTLHISGRFLTDIDPLIKLQSLQSKEYYYCINSTPWQYHFEKDNYISLDEAISIKIRNNDFLKLSYKIPVQDADKIPVIGIKIYTEIITALYC